MSLLQTDTAIICPRVGSQPLCIDLSKVYSIEARIEEVAFVTPTKAPELLARFNEGYLFLHKQICLLEYELVQATREANKIRSIVLLDRVPVILEQKGLGGKNRAGSEDLRNAILDGDEEYQSARETVEQVSCIIELLKGKLKAFEMAYTSVKKLLGEGAFNMLSRNPGTGTNPDTKVGQVDRPVQGFGKARYE
jgi:hypothetical protein